MTPYGYQMGYPQMQNNPYVQQNYSPYVQNTMGLNEIISGSIVDSEDVVRSKNCALDGSATYYPLSDLSAIYVKKLNPQTGAGMMYKYKLEIPEQESIQTTEQQVATLLSEFKNELIAELEEVKKMVSNPTVVEKPVPYGGFNNV